MIIKWEGCFSPSDRYSFFLDTQKDSVPSPNVSVERAAVDLAKRDEEARNEGDRVGEGSLRLRKRSATKVSWSCHVTTFWIRC